MSIKDSSIQADWLSDKGPDNTKGKLQNLIVCFDGTGNDSVVGADEGATNVLLLFDKYVDTANQKIQYVAGVGTSNGKVQNLKEASTGRGISARVKDGYEFLKKHVTPNVGVFIFGFSRGSAQARLLANKLHDEPIDGIDRVAMLGLWDTVSAIGIPQSGKLDNSKLYNLSIPLNVALCCHAVSIDEKRKNFDVRLAKGNGKTRVEEVWFSGDHSDVGGGWQVTNRFLANASLRFMLAHALSMGLVPSDDVNELAELTTDWCDEIHDKTKPVQHEGTLRSSEVTVLNSLVTGGSEERVVSGKLHASVIRRVANSQYLPKNVIKDDIDEIRNVSSIDGVEAVLSRRFEIVDESRLFEESLSKTN